MKTRFLPYLLATIIFTQFTSAFAETTPVTATFLPEVWSADRHEVTLPVRFEITEGWHIYAADTEFGIPTQVKVELEGEAKSDIVLSASSDATPKEFPSPALPGKKITGFEDAVTVNTKITSKENSILPGESVAVEARWVACSKEVCVPGKKRWVRGL